ncbi:MAG: hypothetical protein KF725_15410 [Cyclobacteriaceae bacterium]|nr:hypothetical protein [Cyclobacteriaceae bacterium]UYN87729.1 MAG: hypothetical protein KIT51_05590 [Cyclobacteriaceae bacterium]
MMEQPSNSKHFSNSLLAIWLCVALPFYVAGQQRATVQLKGEVTGASVDRPGDLYIQFADGTIQKYDGNGKLLQEVKPKVPLTVFEPRDGSRAFSYERPGQWYSFAWFGSFNQVKIADEFAIEPWLVCSSGDNNLWVVDAADLSIKKINTGKGSIDVEVLLSRDVHKRKEDLISIREYQNFLFIHNKNTGIEIFNALGKQLRVIPGKDILYFNFLGEELYYVQNNKLIFYDLFDRTIRENTLNNAMLFFIATDEYEYHIYNKKVEIYPAKP